MNSPSDEYTMPQANQLTIHFILFLGSNERIPYFPEMTCDQWGDKSSIMFSIGCWRNWILSKLLPLQIQ
jgi:hypothetical protein